VTATVQPGFSQVTGVQHGGSNKWTGVPFQVACGEDSDEHGPWKLQGQNRARGVACRFVVRRALRGARCAQSLQHTGTPAPIYKHGAAHPTSATARPPCSRFSSTPKYKRFPIDSFYLADPAIRLSIFIRLGLFTTHHHPLPCLPRRLPPLVPPPLPRPPRPPPAMAPTRSVLSGFCIMEQLSNAKQAMITDAIVAVLIPVPISPAHEVSPPPVSVSP